MYKDSTSKLIPNEFLKESHHDYTKTKKVRQTNQRLQKDEQQEAIQKQQNLQSLPQESKGRNLELFGFESEDSEEESCFNEEETNEVVEENENDRGDDDEKENTGQSKCTKIKKFDIKFRKETSQKYQNPFKDIQNCEEKTGKIEYKRKNFNIELSESESDEQEEEEEIIDSNKSSSNEEFYENYIHQNTPNLNLSESKTKNKFKVKFSESSSSEDEGEGSGEGEREREGFKRNENNIGNVEERKKKNKNWMIKKFSSEEEEEKNDEEINREQEEEEEVYIIRNININKLKTHFELNANSNQNYLAFCPIPNQSKISLTIKRDEENSEYIIYDTELVEKIMKVEKSLGGTFKFLIPAEKVEKKWKEIGKMKANFIGTEFHCYTNKFNENGEKTKEKYHTISVKYEVNILGLSGPRKIKLYTVKKPLNLDFNLMEAYEKNKSKSEIGIDIYENKMPKWSNELNSYVLNLRGTATCSSIKNCIIVDEGDKKEFLIIGKKSKNIFNVEVKSPFSLLQGVAFAISSFEKKLACE